MGILQMGVHRQPVLLGQKFKTPTIQRTDSYARARCFLASHGPHLLTHATYASLDLVRVVKTLGSVTRAGEGFMEMISARTVLSLGIGLCLQGKTLRMDF